MGQHDTGVSTAADFVLAGGFWRGSALVEPSCPEDLDEGGSVDVAEVDSADFGMLLDFVGRAVAEDFALIDHIAAVGDFEDLARGVVGNQD